MCPERNDDLPPVTVFPDDASVGAGAVYLHDPLKLEHLMLGT